MLDCAWVSRKLEKFPLRTIPRAGLRPAAVLVPLFVQDGELRVLFTERTTHLHHHGGEISFPGGGQDAGDADLLATALRETQEELGIAGDTVTILGRLDDFYSVHGYHVVPFVGVLPTPLALQIDSFEIARVFAVPVTHFVQPGVHHVEDWTHKGRDYLVDFYRHGEDVIWGLTAAILRQLLQELADAPQNERADQRQARR